MIGIYLMQLVLLAGMTWIIFMLFSLDAQITSLRGWKSNGVAPREVPDESDQIADVRDELSENEIARLQRDQSFDERINRIKAELDKSQYVLRKGTVAEESHPLVKNLPHNIIPDTRNIDPDVEYTE